MRMLSLVPSLFPVGKNGIRPVREVAVVTALLALGISSGRGV